MSDKLEAGMPCARCGQPRHSHIDWHDAQPGQCDTWTFAADALRTPTPEQVGEVEQQAWAWLDRMVSGICDEEAADVTYSADQMVDAFIAGRASTPPAQPTADAVERIAKAMHEADPDVGCTWEEWLAYAEKHPDHLQSVEFTRRQARAVAALTTMAGDYVMVPREGCTCARRHDPDQFDHQSTCAMLSASPTGGE